MIIKRKIWINKNNDQKLVTIPKSTTLKSQDEVYIGTKAQEVVVEMLLDQIDKLSNEDFKKIHNHVNKGYLGRLKTL